jgi:hypothetical protein
MSDKNTTSSRASKWLPSRFRSSSGSRGTLMVLIVAFGAEVGWLMDDPRA